MEARIRICGYCGELRLVSCYRLAVRSRNTELRKGILIKLLSRLTPRTGEYLIAGMADGVGTRHLYWFNQDAHTYWTDDLSEVKDIPASRSFSKATSLPVLASPGGHSSERR